MSKIKIAIIGAGNVASHFVEKIKNTDIQILQICNRHINKAKKLANIVNAEAIDNFEQILPNADIYFFMLSDSGIVEIIDKIKSQKGIFVHTSGTLSKDIFKNHTNNYGVFYPFQTFSEKDKLNFNDLPILLDTSNKYTSEILEKFAQNLKCKVYNIDEKQRQIIHLSGIFASNFANHCVFLGEQILKNENIDIDIIQPLLKQSFNKIFSIGAKKAQTGPAYRNDEIIIEKHLKMLENNRNLSEIYKILSKSIQKTYNIETNE
ncbi:MAG: DUF2520 domain-containing protein [Bacteroidales bacterium]|jgi:predicted short-subunit dehydrogenase-like oxidoreductase (DUF2520 family)|nr:DUF2520 domain-containing protein [Bacteroidales bacterium]